MPSPNATWSGKPPDFPGKDEKGRWVLQRVTAKVWCHSFFQFTTSILRCLFSWSNPNVAWASGL